MSEPRWSEPRWYCMECAHASWRRFACKEAVDVKNNLANCATVLTILTPSRLGRVAPVAYCRDQADQAEAESTIPLHTISAVLQNICGCGHLSLKSLKYCLLLLKHIVQQDLDAWLPRLTFELKRRRWPTGPTTACSWVEFKLTAMLPSDTLMSLKKLGRTKKIQPIRVTAASGLRVLGACLSCSHGTVERIFVCMPASSMAPCRTCFNESCTPP